MITFLPRTTTLLSTIFLILSIALSFSQTPCDSLSPKLIKEFDSYSQNKFNRLKHKKKLDPQRAFNIATYLRQKKDSTYKDWYLKYIEVAKYMYDRGKQDKGSPVYPLFYMGVAYFYMGDYLKAEDWFIKSGKASYTGPCIDYYYAQAEKGFLESLKESDGEPEFPKPFKSGNKWGCKKAVIPSPPKPPIFIKNP